MKTLNVTDPEFKKYGKMALLCRLRTDTWENLGGCMSPFNAYLSYIGDDFIHGMFEV